MKTKPNFLNLVCFTILVKSLPVISADYLEEKQRQMLQESPAFAFGRLDGNRQKAVREYLRDWGRGTPEDYL